MVITERKDRFACQPLSSYCLLYVLQQCNRFGCVETVDGRCIIRLRYISIDFVPFAGQIAQNNKYIRFRGQSRYRRRLPNVFPFGHRHAIHISNVRTVHG